MNKPSICFRLIAMVMAVMLAMPAQLLFAASGGKKVEIGHEPPDDDYLPGFRIQLDATFAGEDDFLATRCYFKSKNDKVFTFVPMRKMQGNEYRAVLPSPWCSSEYIDYLFVVVSKEKVVSRSQMFRIEEKETKEAAQWKDAGEVREIRIDRAQEIIEEYETLRQQMRQTYAGDRPSFQVDDQGRLEVSAELDSSFNINGFYDSINLFRVQPVDRFGLLADELYTAEQIAQNGGLPVVSSATGATSGGMATAAGGVSTAGIIGATVLVAGLVGGGIAIAGSSSDDDDSSGGSSGPVDVGVASEANFYGTYSNKDPNRSTSSWRGVTTLTSGGNGSWEEWFSGDHNSGKLKWSWNQSTRRMVIDYRTGAVFSGTVSGTTYNFTLSGKWANGSSGKVIFTRQ
jgi:hypothetical protein